MKHYEHFNQDRFVEQSVKSILNLLALEGIHVIKEERKAEPAQEEEKKEVPLPREKPEVGEMLFPHFADNQRTKSQLSIYNIDGDTLETRDLKVELP